MLKASKRTRFLHIYAKGVIFDVRNNFRNNQISKMSAQFNFGVSSNSDNYSIHGIYISYIFSRENSKLYYLNIYGSHYQKTLLLYILCIFKTFQIVVLIYIIDS